MTAAALSTPPQSSSYLDALSQAIHKKLQRALASSSQRRNLLQELFADIALEVDNRAKDIIFSKDEDVISPAYDVIGGLLCFYDVLADYFVRVPENGKPILDLIVQLWSQLFASHIFALLFHKWLFEVQLDNPEVLLRYSSALVQGVTNVFWIDIQTNTRRFQSLFRVRIVQDNLMFISNGMCYLKNVVINACFPICLHIFPRVQYLLEDVALDKARLNKIPVQAQRDMYLLLSRFILFYNSADKMESFQKQCPDFPNALLVGGPADIFVTELTDQGWN